MAKDKIGTRRPYATGRTPRKYPTTKMPQILSKDWAEMTCALRLNGQPVRLEDQVELDGEKWKITGGRAPHTMNSSGRVYVERGGQTREYFPTVFGMEWVRT